VLALLHRLYTQILKPWYGQPRWEPIDLYLDHTPLPLFPNLCAHAERDFGFSAEKETIDCPELGIQLSNPFLFLRTEYRKRAGKARLWYRAIGHGDLNLKNVLVDDQENLYVVDFSETRPRNIVSDFARMESILKFQTLPIDSAEELARLVEFEQGLADVHSIAEMPPNRYRGENAEVAKAYAVICRLRSYANTVTLFETDMEPYWLALLEWTYSVLSYDEPPLRRKLAAYSAGIICGRL
jgi:Ternary complex associated domain 9